MKNYISVGKALALKSNHEKHKHSTLCLNAKGKLIWAATNEAVGGLHSEEVVIKEMLANRINLVGTTMLNVRVNGRSPDKIRLAKPCTPCYVQLIQAGVSDIYYTNGVGELEYSDLSKIDLYNQKWHLQHRLAASLSRGPVSQELFAALRRSFFGATFNHSC